MILDIIHSRGRRVPRVVPLKLLAILATIVDKYQLLDAVSAFPDHWLGNVPGAFPTLYADQTAHNDTLLWLNISWVFRDAEKFKNITESMIQHGTDNLNLSQCDDLPLPESIISECCL